MNNLKAESGASKKNRASSNSVLAKTYNSKKQSKSAKSKSSKNNANSKKKKTKKAGRLSKLAQCVRKTANTVRLPRALMPDAENFDESDISPDMSNKFTRLIKQIKDLDEADMKEHKQQFKHFIFTDIRESAYGAKAVASFLLAAGFELQMEHQDKYITRQGKLVKTKLGQTVYEQNKNDGKGFAILQSLPLWKNSLSVETKKTILKVFNSRPENTYGELLRIIVLDSKFKEGIDLYDVKYVHLLEPSIATSDLKQAVGRATRYCGQKGLPFQPKSGWKLQVFIYNTILPYGEPFFLKDKEQKEIDAHSLMLENSGLDLAMINLTQEITILAIQSAVDYELNYNINNFKVEQALLEEQGEEEQAFSRPSAIPTNLDEFKKYKWTKPIVENGCTSPMEKGKAANFTKTQDFIRHYLTPERPIKGLLAWHSVGTGKTCMAVAAATTKFEQAGYTILWVTRNALMADVYKNIFGTICSIPLMKEGVKIPEDPKKQKRLLSKNWMAPVSYRTFQNALEKKNELGRTLYKKNPTDPLYKTFLVIDEIHKLHDGDLSAAEAADFHIIQDFIFKSYQESGQDSVRPLLMTATPITDSPKELFEIINTLIPNEAKRFSTLKDFRKKYTDADGSISDQGKKYYKERASGLVSYLNREFDPTTFTQPNFKTISVPLSTSDNSDIPAFIDAYMKELGIDNLISEEMKEKDCDADLRVALKTIDDQVTEIEKQLKDDSLNKSEKQALKSRILDLKQLMKDAVYKHKPRKIKCMKTNKMLAKAEKKTRKAFTSNLIKEMKAKYKKQSSDQLKAMDKCFQYKRPKSNDFVKIAKEILGLK